MNPPPTPTPEDEPFRDSFQHQADRHAAVQRAALCSLLLLSNAARGRPLFRGRATSDSATLSLFSNYFKSILPVATRAVVDEEAACASARITLRLMIAQIDHRLSLGGSGATQPSQ